MENIKENGKTIRDTERANRLGKMELSSKVNTSSTRKVEMENFTIEMEISMSEHLRKVKEMGKEF